MRRYRVISMYPFQTNVRSTSVGRSAPKICRAAAAVRRRSSGFMGTRSAPHGDSCPAKRTSFYPAGPRQNMLAVPQGARRIKRVELNRWPAGYGNCIPVPARGEEAFGRRLAPEPLRRGGGGRGAGGSRPRAWGGRRARGQTAPRLRRGRGAGAEEAGGPGGRLMRCPTRGPGAPRAAGGRRRAGGPAGTRGSG